MSSSLTKTSAQFVSIFVAVRSTGPPKLEPAPLGKTVVTDLLRVLWPTVPLLTPLGESVIWNEGKMPMLQQLGS